METWRDQALVLSVRPHGEGGAILQLFTEQTGRHAGYVYGASAAAKRPVLQPGNLVQAEWQARTGEQLGSFSLELMQPFPALVMADRRKLGTMRASCALCEEGLPEREMHEDLFQTTLALFTVLSHTSDDIAEWGETYVKWEIAFLRELGFPLDLSRCAGGGDASTLAYISPKSGCAVSYEKGEPYKDRLLPLPAFLKPNGGLRDAEEFTAGLRMTGRFLEKWAFAQHTRGVPEARLALQDLY